MCYTGFSALPVSTLSDVVIEWFIDIVVKEREISIRVNKANKTDPLNLYSTRIYI